MPADVHGEAREALTGLAIAADHPAFAGHFPGEPILPGVVLLDAALDHVRRTDRHGMHRSKILAAKFLRVVRPGDILRIGHERLDGGVVRWTIHSDAGPVASGTFGPA